MEDFYDVIHGVHATSKGYIGTKKTIVEVGKLFECVPRSAIDRYVALCLVCHMWKPQSYAIIDGSELFLQTKCSHQHGAAISIIIQQSF